MNTFFKNLVIFILGVLLFSACSSTNNSTNITTSITTTIETTNDQDDSENALDIKMPENQEPYTPVPSNDITPAELIGQSPPARALDEFRTNFDIHTLDYTEVLSGGPRKDGIPAVDEPKFISVDEADEWLGTSEVVAVLDFDGEVVIYPIQILMWHEIVNDEINGKPVSVTFCPLCNTAIAFSGELNQYVLDFGTTGRLRYSNLLMYDRQTETWWQQATGEAVAGKLTGEHLTFLPIFLLSWEQASDEFPNAQVLSTDTGYRKSYGVNPYRGYDNLDRQPFLYVGPTTPQDLFAMSRVLTIDLNGEAVAFPYSNLSINKVANTSVGGEPVLVLWQGGVSSALDGSTLAMGEDVGTLIAYSRIVNDTTLDFMYKKGKIIDTQTNSEWNIFGLATTGELAGTQLEQVVAINHFWFSWAAFRPDTKIYTADN
jgi:hypothetical protein